MQVGETAESQQSTISYSKSCIAIENLKYMIYVNYKCKKIQLYANKIMHKNWHNINSKVQLAKDSLEMTRGCKGWINTDGGVEESFPDPYVKPWTEVCVWEKFNRFYVSGGSGDTGTEREKSQMQSHIHFSKLWRAQQMWQTL